MPSLVDVHLHYYTVLDKLIESHLFPQGLHQLHLWAEEIEEDPMPILEKLPCLVVLELSEFKNRTMFCSAKGFPRLRRTMFCSAKGFPRLQEMRLGDFSIEEWRIEGGSMPRLSYLHLYWFANMKKLLEGFLHLPSLSELHLEAMSTRDYFRDDVTIERLRGKGCKVRFI